MLSELDGMMIFIKFFLLMLGEDPELHYLLRGRGQRCIRERGDGVCVCVCVGVCECVCVCVRACG